MPDGPAVDVPPPGTRVSLRYRLPPGAARPLTDVVGHVVTVEPTVQVRTRHGDVVEIAPADVTAVRVVPEIPVRTGEIRNLEHAAALGWPGTEHEWSDGWLLRFAHGVTRRANSAVPLHFSSQQQIADAREWYHRRGVTPLISVPDRLLRLPPSAPADAENLVMTVDLDDDLGLGDTDVRVDVTAAPDDDWLTTYERDVPVDVLTAVVDGVVGFGAAGRAAVGRVAVTEAPDGTRWAGVSAVRVAPEARRQGLARTVCAGLLGWAREHGATRGYVQVVVENGAARTLYDSMGFGLHHRSRYVRADDLL